MKNILVVLAMVLFVASLAFGQATGHGSPLGTGGTQGVKSGMINGMHDFTKDSSKNGFKGPSNSLCGYCHAIHIPANGVPTPLWSRASVNGRTYGAYTNAFSLDASPVDPGASGDNNYSSLCLSCHDGSIAPFAASAYVKTPYNYGVAWDSAGTNGLAVMRMDSAVSIVNGEYGNLSHTHPVNFTYNTALATADGGLYDPALSPSPNNYMFWSTQYGAVGRLFNGKVQCSSCHDPHINQSGIMLNGSSKYGALCVACHKK
jgi:predicted CXXCH cytochrome family protein